MNKKLLLIAITLISVVIISIAVYPTFQYDSEEHYRNEEKDDDDDDTAKQVPFETLKNEIISQGNYSNGIYGIKAAATDKQGIAFSFHTNDNVVSFYIFDLGIDLGYLYTISEKNEIEYSLSHKDEMYTATYDTATHKLIFSDLISTDIKELMLKYHDQTIKIIDMGLKDANIAVKMSDLGIYPINH